MEPQVLQYYTYDKWEKKQGKLHIHFVLTKSPMVFPTDAGHVPISLFAQRKERKHRQLKKKTTTLLSARHMKDSFVPVVSNSQ